MRRQSALGLAALLLCSPLIDLASAQEGCDVLHDGCCAPKLLIIGAMKCGTNAIMGYLSRHPAFKTSIRQPEIHFFSWPLPDGAAHNSEEGRRRYLSKLVCHRPGETSWVVDKSPSYINDPAISTLAHEMLPNAKVLAMLCDPAERRWKEWWHNLRHHRQQQCAQITPSLGVAKKVFDLELQEEMQSFKDTPHDALARGMYASHLRHWVDAYGKDNVMAIDSGVMELDPLRTVLNVLRFLGLNETEYQEPEQGNLLHVYKSSHPDLHPEARQRLNSLYHKDSLELAQLIGEDWPAKWADRDGYDPLEAQVERLKRACLAPTNGLAEFIGGQGHQLRHRPWHTSGGAPAAHERAEVRHGRRPRRSQRVVPPEDVIDVTGKSMPELQAMNLRPGQVVKVCNSEGVCKLREIRGRSAPR
mmetsp:Transcript_19799/g.55025  ORF Transcript_19799/g.55025 Transcript_19799/m.55025 type:complete len:416 (+) Transcript_19799:329-1576(+)